MFQNHVVTCNLVNVLITCWHQNLILVQVILSRVCNDGMMEKFWFVKTKYLQEVEEYFDNLP